MKNYDMLKRIEKIQGKHEIDVLIDEITPCLIHRQSGEQYKTQYQPLTKEDLKSINRKSGWLFNWKTEFGAPDREVFKLLVVGSDEIQGLVSLSQDQGFVFVHLVENAPSNIGSERKQFIGVGAHLFAIACKISLEAGFEGFVSFLSKSNLLSHYEEEIGALRLGNSLLMEINPQRAMQLVKHYFKESEIQ